MSEGQIIDVPAGGLWTRERVLQAMGVHPDHFRRAFDRTVQGLDATHHTKRRVRTFEDGTTEETIEEGGAPDHAIRLKAAAQICEIAGLKSQPSVEASFTGPVTITWTPPSLSPSSPRPLTSGPSTNGSNGTTSSSATGDSGRPSWL